MGDFKEGKTGIVDLPCRDSAASGDMCNWDADAEDPKAIKLMIHYLYHLDYLEVEMTKIKEAGAKGVVTDYNVKDGILVDHARMYAMGDKYGISGLKCLARDMFKKVLEYTGAGLSNAMMIAFTSTVDSDKGLRRIIVDLLHNNSSILINKPEIDQNIKDLPELAYALLRKQLKLSY